MQVRFLVTLLCSISPGINCGDSATGNVGSEGSYYLCNVGSEGNYFDIFRLSRARVALAVYVAS